LADCPSPGSSLLNARGRVSEPYGSDIGAKPGPASQRERAGRNRVSAAQGWCGRDRIRTCEGIAGDFTGRSAVSPQVPSHPHPVPIIARDVHKRPIDGFGGHSASPPVAPVPRVPASGGAKVERNPGRRPDPSPTPMWLAEAVAISLRWPPVALRVAGAAVRYVCRLGSCRGHRNTSGTRWEQYQPLQGVSDRFLACSSWSDV
jgi:hypothetical protein